MNEETLLHLALEKSPLFAAGAQETFVVICICIFAAACILAGLLAIGLLLIDARLRAKKVEHSTMPKREHPSGRYCPSGKYDWWRLLTVALPLSLLAACVLAFVLHLALIYSVGLLIIPILAGGLLGGLASGLFRFAHCRNPRAAGGFAILLASVMYVGMLHCQHVAVVGPSVLTRLDLLPEFICNLEQHMQEKPGAGNPRKPAPKVGQQKKDADAVIIFGFCGLGWLGAACCCGMVLVGGARRAYCETCSRWMLIKKATAGPGVAAEVAAAIEYRKIASLPDRREEKCFLASKFEVECCPGKNGQDETCPIYLTAKERRGKGTATLARQIRLNPVRIGVKPRLYTSPVARKRRSWQSQGMPRPARIDYPDALYHVTSRGNGRAA